MASDGGAVIRDTEIEQFLYECSDPIFRTAGLTPSAVDLLLINSPSVNAFVAGGSNIFIYTGLILETETPLELVSVIAHEVGHISGGHLIRFSEAIERAQTNSLIAMVLGGVVAAGTGQGEGGMAASHAAQSILERNLLGYARVQENAADQASFQFLKTLGLSLKGSVSFFEKLSKMEGSSSSYTNQYTRTHPLTKDRVLAAKEKFKEYPDGGELEKYRDRYERIKAKIFAYNYPDQVAFLYSGGRVADLYAQAVAAYRQDNMEKFLDLIDSLINKEHDNPYFLELKGQALFENGRIAEALIPLEKAVMLMPNAPLIRTLYAHALVETGQKPYIKQAIGHLEKALGQERANAFRYHLLSLAYGRLGDVDRAKLYQAHRALLIGDHQQLSKLLEELAGRFDVGTTQWLRLQDLNNFNKKETK